MNVARMKFGHIIFFVVVVFVLLFLTKVGIFNHVRGMSSVRDDNTKEGSVIHTKTCSCLADSISKEAVRNEKTGTLSGSSTELANINYTDIMSLLNRAKVSADDKMLVEVLRKHFIQPPSTLPYNLTEPGIKNPSPKQTQVVDKLLDYKTGGFYVDCGAYDGEYVSNSLFLERFRSWNGVLLEPNPVTHKELMDKNRKAYTMKACLSVTKSPELVSFFTGATRTRGKIVESYKNTKLSRKHITAQCFPLYSVLLALDKLTVDYFSLDVEGGERGVLESLPWDKVDIKTLSIEWTHWKGGRQNLKAYMARKGYSMVTEANVGHVARDLIFMKK